MTERQKQIYNFYLRAYRVNNNQPYRPKKNFKDFEQKEEYRYIVQLDSFFYKFPHLFKMDFFNAPYKLYNDEKKFYNLQYYASYKGLTTCIEYYKNILNSNPDEHIDFIKESLKFVANFCIDHNIPLIGYCDFKSVAQNDFLKHIKEHKISWYVIFGLPNGIDILHNMTADEFELYFGTEINISSIQMKYNNSNIAKNIIEKGVRKLKKFVEIQRQKV